MNISKTDAYTMSTLSLDASLIDGHVNLGVFRSIEALEIFCSNGLSGLTSLDLSENLNFYKIHISSNLPNLKRIVLNNPNQAPYLSANQYSEKIGIFEMFEKAREAALIETLLKMIKDEIDPVVEQFLIGLLDNYRRQLELKEHIKETKNALAKLNEELKTSIKIHKTTEIQLLEKYGSTQMPYEIHFESFPAARLKHEHLTVPETAITKIHDGNTALLGKKQIKKTK